MKGISFTMWSKINCAHFLLKPERVLNFVNEKYFLYSSYAAAPRVISGPYYHPQTNPQGVVNLGKATNYLMEKEVFQQLKDNRVKYEVDREHLPYYLHWEPDNFERELARFITKFFQLPQTLEFNNLTVLNSVSASIDLLGFLLGDPNDVFLCPSPAYSGLFQDGSQRSSIEVISVPLQHDLETGKYFNLSVQVLEKAVQEQSAANKTVRGIFIVNPNNPLGTVYGKDQLWEIMEFCKRHELHVIFSEVYGLSVFDEKTKFYSVLKFGTDVPDLERTHVLWGFTKDLCLTGFRTGVIYTRCEYLLAGLRASSMYQVVPVPMQQILSSYLQDHEWIEKVFIAQNHNKMRYAFTRAKTKLESLGIQVLPSKAGFFLLCNFRSFLTDPMEDNAKELFEKFIDNNVYVVPHWDMRCGEPGWIRIIFTVEDDVFDTGFSRIKRTLEEWIENKHRSTHE